MNRKLLIGVIALQLAWVAGTVAVQETRLRTGVRVLLETAPVDPRDLLRGDYLTLEYKISTLPRSLMRGLGTNQLPAGTPVYVRLSREGRFHVATEASTSPIATDAAHPVLEGRSSPAVWWWQGADTNSVHVAYGLERYYVREGTGNPRGQLTVEVSVPRSGRGVIHEVFLDGHPYRSAMRDVAR